MVPSKSLNSQEATGQQIIIYQEINNLITKSRQSGPRNVDAELAITDSILNQVTRSLPHDSLGWILYQSGNEFFKNEEFTIARHLARRAFDVAEKQNDRASQMLALLLQGSIFFQLQNADSTRYYLNKAEATGDEASLTEHLATILHLEANLESLAGNRLTAIDLYLRSLDLLKREDRMSDVAVVYDNIGTLHMSMKNYVHATEYLHQAYAIMVSENDSSELTRIALNLGISYQKQDSVEKSEYFYNQALELSKLLNNKFDQARAYSNLGSLMLSIKNYNFAELYTRASLQICREDNIQFGIALNLLNLSEIQLMRGEIEPALRSMEQGHSILTPMKITAFDDEIFRIKSLIYEKMNDEKVALDYYKRHIALRDSLNDIEHRKIILEMDARYNQKELALELSRLSEDMLKRQLRNRLMLIILLTMGILLGIVALLLLKARNVALRRETIALKRSEQLSQNLELKGKELVSKELQISRKNQLTGEISEKLKTLLPHLDDNNRKLMRQVINEMNTDLPKHYWQEFEARYEQVHEDFYHKLKEKCPSLTPTELKIASLLRLNMTSKEISALTNRSVGTIDNTRSSIRKKINIDSDSNLATFLLSL